MASCDFGDASPSIINPGQRVIALRRAHIDEHPFRLLAGGIVRARGVHHVRQLLDGLLEGGVGVGGVLPDLVGVGGEVDLAVGVAVQDARLLVVEVVSRLGLVVLEEGLVGTDDLGSSR